MNEKQLNRVLNRLAEELVPASVDLWPDIRKRFESSNRHSIKGDFSMAPQVDHHKRFVKPLRLAGLCILALLICQAWWMSPPWGAPGPKRSYISLPVPAAIPCLSNPGS